MTFPRRSNLCQKQTSRKGSMIKTKGFRNEHRRLYQFEQTVEKQIKVVQRMKLEEMKLAREIWQNAAERMHEVIIAKEKETSEILWQENAKDPVNLESPTTEISVVSEILQAPDKSPKTKNKSKTSSVLTEPRKSNRVRKTPRKYVFLHTGRKKPHQTESPSATSPKNNTEKSNPDKDVTKSNSQDQEASSELQPETSSQLQQEHQNQNFQNSIAKTLVQNFITKVCQEHDAGKQYEKNVQDTDFGDSEGSKEHCQKNLIKMKKNKRKSAAKTKSSSGKRGRKSYLSDDEMINQGFKRMRLGGFICLTCRKTFPTPNKAKLHARIHSGTRPHKCSKCDKTFLSGHSLRRHEMLHSDQLPFQCPIAECHKSYVEKRTLEKHIAAKHQHENCDQNEKQSQSYKCEECGKEVKYKVNLKVHMKLCHEGKRDHQCSVCGKLFQTKGNLIRHLVCHSSERPHSCDKCHQTFKTRDTLQKHMLLHENRPHKCSICNKGFITNYKLMEHMNSHQKDTVFLCEQCGQAFSHRNTLRSHYKVHFADRKYKCSVCDWAFYTNSDLRRHRLSHSDDRPFECHICGKSFARKDSFQKHLRIHGGAAIYRCFYCGQSFWDKLKGKRHVLWCTGGDNNQEHAPETQTEGQQHLDTIEGAALESNLDQTEEPNPDTSASSSTVLNLTGMNLDILSIDSGYLIVRKPPTGDDPEEDNRQIVIAQSSQAIQEIHNAMQQEVYEGMANPVVQIEGLSSNQELEDSGLPREGAFEQDNETGTNTAQIVTVNENAVSPLEQAMQQAGLHRQDILHLQTQEKIHRVTISSNDEPITQQSTNSDRVIAAVLPSTFSNVQTNGADIEERPNGDLAEALRFSGNADDQNTFPLNEMDCFPDTEPSQCSEDQDGTDANKNSDTDQWFQW